MVIKKKSLTLFISEKLFVVYLILFPLGQLISKRIWILGKVVPIHPIEVILIVIVVLNIKNITSFIKVNKQLQSLILVVLFSFVFSTTIFNLNQMIIGFLYILRLFSYVGLIFIARVSLETLKKDRIVELLLILSLSIILIGWLQYIIFPDLRILKYLGWDDHRFRLVGALLDPAFMGLMAAFGAILTIGRYFENKKASYLLFHLIFLVTVLFTYSRASYIALALGVIYLLYSVKIKVKIIVFAILLGLISVAVFIPRPEGSEGVKLERVYSIVARVDDYKNTISIWKNSPVFGVGYNNLCISKKIYDPSKKTNEKNNQSHSCSGSDSGILLILSTTGVVGLLIVAGLIIKFIMAIKRDVFGTIFIASLVIYFVHAQFVNSLLYPWVVGWLILLSATVTFVGQRKPNLSN